MESGIEIEMEEATTAPAGRPDLEAPVIKGSSAKDSDDADFVYDRTRFRKYKAFRRFKYYDKRRVVVERGLEVAEFDVRVSLIQEVLEAQGWTKMLEDHCPSIEELVREFYTNLHRRVGYSFFTWIKGKAIQVTPDLISTITGAPRVHNLEYPWPVDHSLPEQRWLSASCYANLIALAIARVVDRVALRNAGSNHRERRLFKN